MRSRLGLAHRAAAADLTRREQRGTGRVLFTEADDGAVRFVALPPPAPADVARVAASVSRRVQKALDRAGLLDVEVPPEDDAESLRARALQQSLPFVEATALAAVQPTRHHRRVAVADGVVVRALLATRPVSLRSGPEHPGRRPTRADATERDLAPLGTAGVDGGRDASYPLPPCTASPGGRRCWRASSQLRV